MMHKTLQHGFTLLEVMIALVIFSIGLIGLAGLQAISLQNNQVAYSRTIATQFAYDLADRIRNNKNNSTAAVANYAVAIPGTAPTSCVGTGANCNSTAMVQYDLWSWDQALKKAQANLTSARGFVTATATGYSISIGWDETREGRTPTGCSPPTGTPDNQGIECVTITVDP